MKKTVWTFGLVSGAIISVLMAAAMGFQDAVGGDKGEIIGYTTMVLSFLLIFFGVRSYRDNVAGGRVGFGRAFLVGSLIALISSACYVATWEVIFFKVSPNFSAKYAAHMVEKARASGASQAAIDAKIAEMQKFQTMYANPLANIAITFMEPLPVGLVIALLSAGILRRKRDQSPSPALARATG